jgi:hypothetical protein
MKSLQITVLALVSVRQSTAAKDRTNESDKMRRSTMQRAAVEAGQANKSGELSTFDLFPFSTSELTAPRIPLRLGFIFF